MERRRWSVAGNWSRVFCTAAALVAASLALAGCPSGETDIEAPCEEGRSVECACGGGEMGKQVCRADGTWGPCQCDSGGDAATEDAGVTATDTGEPVEDSGTSSEDVGDDETGPNCSDFEPDAEPCTTGRVTAIAPDEHPNLYFDEAEIAALRESIVENRRPQKAADAYFNHIRGTSPAHKPDDFGSLDWPDNFYAGMSAATKNMKASIHYMLEPSTARAEDLRDALYSWTQKQGPYWTYAGQQSGWIHISLAFMYDLIYNSEVIDDEDRRHFDDWFAYVADNAIRSNEFWTDERTGEDNPVVDKEGFQREAYPNWWTIQVSCGLVSAMVSHDQAMVDKGFDSDVPADYFKSDLSDYEGTRDLENLINGSVFPSGYNWDGYKRNYGFDAPEKSFSEAGEPDRGQGQTYHFFSIFPMIFAAEAAAHNGDNAWAYGDHAILRTFKRASAWADTAYRSGDNYDQRHLYRLLYRHYPEDPDVRQAVEAVPADHYTQRLIDKTSAVWAALGEIEVD